MKIIDKYMRDGQPLIVVRNGKTDHVIPTVEAVELAEQIFEAAGLLSVKAVTQHLEQKRDELRSRLGFCRTHNFYIEAMHYQVQYEYLDELVRAFQTAQILKDIRGIEKI